MYDMYPFWYTLFTSLGFRVKLSPDSNQNVFEKGLRSLVAENVCYSAKLVHGHIMALIDDSDIDIIFYPTILRFPNELVRKYDYTCRIFGCYSSVIKNNINFGNKKLIDDIFEFDSYQKMTMSLIKCFNRCGLQLNSYYVMYTLFLAFREQQKYYDDVFNKGTEILKYLKDNDKFGIVLCGKPYHIDKLISHGVADLIEKYNIPVLTEISLINIGRETEKFHDKLILDWEHYMSRIYRACNVIVKSDNLYIVHLTSFGCYNDGFGSEIVDKFLTRNNKIYTMIKLDDTNNLGSIKIRIRSLIHTINEKIKQNNSNIIVHTHVKNDNTFQNIDKNKILICLNFSHIMSFLPYRLKRMGYNIITFDDDLDYLPESIKYGGNMCPMVNFQSKIIINAIKKLKINIDDVYFVIQTLEGPCNICEQKTVILDAVYNFCGKYINYIGVGDEISFAPYVICNDFLMNTYLSHQIFGDQVEIKTLYDKWFDVINKSDRISLYNPFTILNCIKDIILDFQKVNLNRNLKYPKIGIIGVSRYFDIITQKLVIDYLKNDSVIYMNQLIVILYHYYSRNKFDNILQKLIGQIGNTLHSYFGRIENIGFTNIIKLILSSIPDDELFYKPKSIDIDELINNVTNIDTCSDEMRLYIAEMIYLLENNINNIILIDSLNCTSSVVAFKGLIGSIKKIYPRSQFISIGYDPNISITNLQNRLNLFLEVAKENMNNTDQREYINICQYGLKCLACNKSTNCHFVSDW